MTECVSKTASFTSAEVKFRRLLAYCLSETRKAPFLPILGLTTSKPDASIPSPFRSADVFPYHSSTYDLRGSHPMRSRAGYHPLQTAGDEGQQALSVSPPHR